MSFQNTPNSHMSQEPGPISTVLSYVGFGVGIVLMIAFIPISESHMINGIVGAVVGIVGGGTGSFLGGLLDS